MAPDDSAVHDPTPTLPPPNRFLNFNDPTNPFQLDHGDNPSVSLVPDLLTVDNYTTWSRAMQRALRAKNKLGFVNGEVTKPTTPSDPLFQPWERCNDMFKLRERFTQQNGSRIFHLKKTLAGLHQDHDPVSVYFGKLKAIWDELNLFDPLPDCSCGQLKILSDRYHRDCVIQFLMGLNDSYTNSRDQIMLLDPLPSVGKVFSLIQQQEHQHIMLNTNPSPDSMVLAVKKFSPTSKLPHKSGQTQKPRLYCTHCHLTGHTLETCFKVSNAAPPTCTHCHMSGHVAEKCYKLHGYPPGHKFFNRAKSSPVFANSASAEPDVDSPATVALTKDQYHQLLHLLQHKEHLLMPSSSTNSSPTALHPHANSATAPTMSAYRLSPPLLGDLKQSLLLLANFNTISAPISDGPRSKSLSDRIGLCYVLKNRISRSDEDVADNCVIFELMLLEKNQAVSVICWRISTISSGISVILRIAHLESIFQMQGY
ncbi:hypothetical protein F0562_023186 [Nyssa sinensis]|uniref:Retrotransposon Copia-like N-terminal domain-containing protein n=1 Tax=Nyssa sinensis TaxID=561372 RepID=A0A5J5BH98_9ASTE|nr:hypothetical protein F0562_023186 [Nyssa sinensis]